MTDLIDVLRNRSALVLWDVDNKLEDRTVNTALMLERTCALLDGARAHGVPRIWAHHQFLPPAFESEAYLRSLSRWGIQPGSEPMPGSEPGFRDDVSPRDDELVLHKFRTSFFVGTPFRDVLANIGADAIVLCGASTDTGIVGTARDAVARGVTPVVARDAVTARSDDRHESGLAEVETMGYVGTTDAIVQAWCKGE